MAKPARGALGAYEAKRNFSVTPEPPPATAEAASAAPIFVVQKHLARRAGLHWDFRLEHGGVLWSWAVRKGPSLDPAERRLAAHVEDHPLDYAEFHGTIPEGYGAGTVETWDRGTWEPIGDAEAGMAKGDLQFVLHGTRLNGRFHLVRLKRRERERQDAWLLIKGHDEYERLGVDATALEAEIPFDPGGEPGIWQSGEREPHHAEPKEPRRHGAIVVARAPQRRAAEVAGVAITHADRELWPGITKRDLAEYWREIAPAALPGLAHRPLAVVRYPEGITGERFFQKRGQGVLPAQVREGEVAGSPYLAIDAAEGLIAAAQMSAIEIHPWGAPEADPRHPDFIVFDLDPGEGVPWADVVRAALDVRERLARLELASFCRTTGGKGLHVVAPLAASPEWDWERVKAFCRAFAELMTDEAPERYLAHLKLADRPGRVLVDWLRNGMGSTAIGSYCPRARPGAPVATPLAWTEVTPKLDPAAFTLRTIPRRLARMKRDPWHDFFETGQRLPDAAPPPERGRSVATEKAEPRAGSRSRIVVARRRRSSLDK